jgi:ribosomal protein S18 acetylase RimI-like enzyme
MTYEVRRVEAAEWRDLRELRLLALKTDPEAFGDTHAKALARDDASWITWAARLASADDRAMCVALDETGNRIGLTGFFVPESVPDGSPPRAVVISVWVAPEHRGGGAEGPAALLADAVLELARASAAEELVLEVADNNPRAIGFYRRTGWVETGRVRPGENHDGDYIEMWYPAFRA